MILLASFYFASYMLDEIPRLLIATPMAAFFLWGHAAKILYIFLRDYTEIPYHLNILASPMKEQLRAEEIAASNSYKNKFFILGLSGAQCIVIIIGCLLCGISYLDSLVEAVLRVLISIVELLPLLLVLPLYRIQAMFPYFPTPVARVPSLHFHFDSNLFPSKKIGTSTVWRIDIAMVQLPLHRTGGHYALYIVCAGSSWCSQLLCRHLHVPLRSEPPHS